MDALQKISRRTRYVTLATLLALAACGGGESQTTPPVKAPPQPSATAPVASAAPAPTFDPIGPKPTLGPRKPFTPPTATVFKAKNGLTVWLVPRQGLPLVSVSLVVPRGSAADPADKPGLASITTDMLDEGAGKRSAVEVSSAINDLGATLGLGTSYDGSVVSLTVLKNNFPAAFGIFSDVVARPRFEDKEWKRVSDLWRNDLKKRADDPNRVARLVVGASLYGPGTAYGHPIDGLLAGAEKIDLKAVKDFYKDAFRPDRSILVVAGDITQKEITDAIDASMGTWKAPAGAKTNDAAKDKAEGPRASGARPRVVLVNRPGAAQSVIAVVRDGVAASDPDAPGLELVNTVLGGSFTSRLNQNLREEHHWAYGAGSSFYETRAQGPFIAIASVETPATGPALKEMLGELSRMSAAGMDADELEKAKAQDRADVMQAYETVNGTVRRLATLARLGLGPGHDAEASRSRQDATLEQINTLAKRHVEPSGSTIVVVGPRDEVVPQLEKIGLPAPEAWDAEGKPITAAAPAKDDAKPAAKKDAPKAPKKK
jgi:predicted Zn-dependent peptidase